MTGTIDAHLHLWDLERADYPWLTAASGPLLHRSCRPEELAPQLPAAGVDRAILVQASETDTAHLLELHQRYGFVAGVVGWLPLHDPEAMETHVRPDGLVGVRYDIARCDDAPQRSLDLLAQAGVSLDLAAITTDDLARVERITARAPGLTVVLDHLGNPPARAEDLAAWAAALRRIAAHPTTYAKVSGLGTAGRRRAWDPAGLAPIIDTAVEVFGAHRLMVGSDWPISTQVSDYAATMDMLSQLLEHLSEPDRTSIRTGTARTAYARGRWT